MLPIHPIAAIVLKNIATAYQANQRSMFDLIKTPKDLDTKALQWVKKVGKDPLNLAQKNEDISYIVYFLSSF
jgi:hypothetical protein